MKLPIALSSMAMFLVAVVACAPGAAGADAAPAGGVPSTKPATKPAPSAAIATPAVNDASPTPSAATPAAIVALRDEIDDFNRTYFTRRFEAAKAAGAKTIIVEIDTYGGLVTAGLDISRFLKNQSGVHTIAYVHYKAISAGAMIAMACDEIVMSDSAVIGDCAPITVVDGQMKDLEGDVKNKVLSPTVADFQESAERNHHDPLLAKAMVVAGFAVHGIVDGQGNRRFVNDIEFEELTKKHWQPDPALPDPIKPKEQFLTLHTDLAVKLGLASGIAASTEQLASDRRLKIVAEYRPGFGEAAVAWLNSGWVRMLIMAIFTASLWAAFHAPGHGSSEAIALLSGGMLLGVPLLAGYATWWEIAMIVVGLGLVAFEIFVFPHTGLMVVAGVVLMAVGLVLTFVGLEPAGMPGFLPQLQGTRTAIQYGLLYFVGGCTCSMLLCWWLSAYLPKLPYFSRLVLNTVVGQASDGGESIGRDTAATSAAAMASGRAAWQPMIGTIGRAITQLSPGGTAEFIDDVFRDRHICSVVSETGFVDTGTEIIIREVAGSRIVVRAV